MSDGMDISKGRDDAYRLMYALANDPALLDRMQKALGITAAAVPAPLGKPQIKTKIIGDLEWQEEVPDRDFTWERAKTYATSLGDGWRLPTVQELTSLWDYDENRCVVFPADARWYWSASSGGPSSAWYMHFATGGVSSHNKDNKGGSVRCVRDVKGGK